MQTDSIFYEVFRFDPQSVLRLVQLHLDGRYEFESITVKSTEKRFDGFLWRVDGKGPYIFIEVQAYYDPKIYWRLYREVCTFYEQREEDTPFIAIVLFLDENYDPGEFGVTCLAPCTLVRANLIECLKKVEGAAGALTPLMPLAIKTREELAQAAPRWQAEISSLQLPESREKYLLELLVQVLAQKFTTLTEEEVSAMLHLTPFEETTLGKQIYGRGVSQGISQGISQGLLQGFSKGELIGKIHFAQKVLRLAMTPHEELAPKSHDELSLILQQLENKVDALLNTMAHA